MHEDDLKNVKQRLEGEFFAIPPDTWQALLKFAEADLAEAEEVQFSCRTVLEIMQTYLEEAGGVMRAAPPRSRGWTKPNVRRQRADEYQSVLNSRVSFEGGRMQIRRHIPWQALAKKHGWKTRQLASIQRQHHRSRRFYIDAMNAEHQGKKVYVTAPLGSPPGTLGDWCTITFGESAKKNGSQADR